MPFKSSLARSAGKLLGVYRERDTSLRGATQKSRVLTVQITATGGDATTTPGDGYKYHYYTTTGAGPSFVISAGNDYIEYVVVAGGGGAGSNGFHSSRFGSGGGAGGFRTNFPGVVDASPAPLTAGSSDMMLPGTYPVTVGAGGAGGSEPTWGCGTVGGDSTLTLSVSPIVSAGGGGGIGHEYPGTPNPTPDPMWTGIPTTSGGSGGGGFPGDPTARVSYAGNVPSVSPPQGNSGGIWTPWHGGGGGGAGAAGNPGGVSSGKGGDGVAVPQLPPSYGVPGPSPGRWFAGGGSGDSSPTAAAGGGGGAPGNHGSANTGGGGGGTAGPSTAGNGGSGIIVIRYLV